MRGCCGLQGFLPTLLEDVPDMAVKFAVYETLRPLHQRVFGGRQVRMTCPSQPLAQQHACSNGRNCMTGCWE